MRLYILSIGLLISGIGFFLWYPQSIITAYQTTASYLMYPVIKIHTTIVEPCRALYSSLERYTDLLHAYNELQEKHDQVCGKLIALEATDSYADDVERELHWFKKRFETESAHVVPVMAVHQTDRQHIMLIEGGSQRGIQRDMVVLADSVLLGKVVTVYSWYSIVQLVTDPSSWVAVYGVCSNAHGLVRGTGDPERLLLERVEHLSPVQEDELLLSSGDGMVVPRGYGLGTVETYNSDGLYYTGRVKTLSDPRKLKTCLVVNRAELLKIS